MWREAVDRRRVTGSVAEWFAKLDAAARAVAPAVMIKSQPDDGTVAAVWVRWAPPHRRALDLSVADAGRGQVHLTLSAKAHVSVDWVILSAGFGLGYHTDLLWDLKRKLGFRD